jgi:signal transduction histidine kinase
MTNRKNTQQSKQWQIALDLLTTLSYQSNDLSSYLQEITQSVSRLLKSDWSIVTLQEGSQGQVVASNLDLAETDTAFEVHKSVSEIVITSGQPFVVKDVKQHPEEAERMSGYACYLGVPLRTLTGEVIGTICSFSAQPQAYSAETVAAIELFSQRAATAIDNYRLYQQQLRFNDLLEAEVNKRTAELRSAQTTLIERERLAAIGELASMIVHEIRNPLTTVQMGLDYFAKLDLPKPAKARLDLARGEAQRLTQLLQEILSYSKPQILRLVEIDVNTIVQEILTSLRSMPEAQDRLIEYVPSRSSVVILADVDKLKQVLINLIRNACEAVEPGETVRCAIAQAPRQQICISIHNGGLPIAEELIPQLTQPFYSTKSEGTGLGLAIVKRIVEAHSGELLITSSEHEGTVFSVQLPLRSAQSSA